jgi:hypothetical protein
MQKFCSWDMKLISQSEIISKGYRLVGEIATIVSIILLPIKDIREKNDFLLLHLDGAHSYLHPMELLPVPSFPEALQQDEHLPLA